MAHAISIVAEDRPGVLRDIAGAVASLDANITFVQQYQLERGAHAGKARVYMEVEGLAQPTELERALGGLPSVVEVQVYPPFEEIYGSRVIIIGGGAQVGQVAVGAVSEADRHNLRGERISVDTIPLVGEDEIADAVEAVDRLHRAAILVLAGSLMGGRITREVKKLQGEGIPVIALNMAGSVADHADLVVTDPIQAGTFAVMHVAKTAKFDIAKVRGRRF